MKPSRSFSLLASSTFLFLASFLLSSQAQTTTISRKGDIPSKWLQKAKGYEQALEIQKKTGADIFIYFTRQAPSDEKGLCKWFESKALSDVQIRKHLRDYIKVQVPLPSNPDCQKLAATFEVGKTPAVYIVQPNRHPQKCPVFDWKDKKPKLLGTEELIAVFLARSSERKVTP